MIERAIQCKNAYTSLMLDESLTMFFLEDVEWRRLAALRDLLGRFDQLTTKVCASKTYATITLTVVVYNSLMAAIENFIKENRQRLPNICRGADAARANLAQYYAATDNSPIYSVATAIHPAMRFQYWSDQQWKATYESNAKKAVRSAWKERYSCNNCETATEPPILDPHSDNMELTLLGLSN
jgi:hypothetical protein